MSRHRGRILAAGVLLAAGASILAGCDGDVRAVRGEIPRAGLAEWEPAPVPPPPDAEPAPADESLAPARAFLFLGLDGATWKVLSPMLREGAMPNLARLLRRASYGLLATDVGRSGTSWTTLATGFSHAAHGIEPERFEAWRGSARLVRRAQIWDMLPRQRFPRLAVLDYYFPPREPEFPGIVLDHGRFYPDGAVAAPVIGEGDGLDPGTRMLAWAIRHVPYDAGFAIVLQTDGDSHAMFFGFQITADAAQADLKWADGARPHFLAARERLRGLYRRLDEYLREFVGRRDRLLVIASDHGFRSADPPREVLQLNEAFFAALGAAPQDFPLRLPEPHTFDAAVDGQSARLTLRGRTFSVPVARIRSTGRTVAEIFHAPAVECRGTGTSCPPAVDRCLSDLLSSATDGGPLYRRETSLFSRAVVFEPRPEAIRALARRTSDPADAPFSIIAQFGTHDRQDPGILILAGPGVRRGSVLSGARLVDVAPTVLALLGVPVARDFEGRVLSEALDERFLAANPIQEIDTYGAGHPVGGEAITPDEKTLRKLRALGYIQ